MSFSCSCELAVRKMAGGLFGSSWWLPGEGGLLLLRCSAGKRWGLKVSLNVLRVALYTCEKQLGRRLLQPRAMEMWQSTSTDRACPGSCGCPRLQFIVTWGCEWWGCLFCTIYRDLRIPMDEMCSFSAGHDTIYSPLHATGCMCWCSHSSHWC